MNFKCNSFVVFFLTLLSVCGQYHKCNFLWIIDLANVNKTVQITSPSYPKYVKNMDCRWVVSAPPGYHCIVDCKEFFSVPVLPQDQCAVDHLLISRSGNLHFEAAELYCGHGAVTTKSFGRNISIGLIANFKARLSCDVTAATAVNENCTCGYKQANRSIKGRAIEEYKYPSVVGVMALKPQKMVCGGVIVDSRHVLTAAHCVLGMKVKKIGVIAGEKAIAEAKSGYRIDKILVHPMYFGASNDFDAALIRVAKEIVFSDAVGPVCLPFKFVDEEYADMTGANLTVLGWNTTYPAGGGVLRKTNVSIAEWERCLSVTTFFTARHLCTYTHGPDSCQGVPGGPLLYTDPSNGLVFNLGITNHGRSCSASPLAVATRVTKILHWITRTTKVDYCRK